MSGLQSLDDLLALGVLVASGEHERPVTWVREDGKSVTFKVLVKAEMTAADHEFIYLGMAAGSSEDAGRSYLARRIHRLVRLAGGAVIPMDVADRMKPELLRAINAAISTREATASPES